MTLDEMFENMKTWIFEVNCCDNYNMHLFFQPFVYKLDQKTVVFLLLFKADDIITFFKQTSDM